jgi:hypothetical protein
MEFGDDAVGFAALNLSDHEYKKWGEIDFVILTEEGLIVIEVKGGQVSLDNRGIWRYESRGRNVVERTESPIAQASSAYFSLCKKFLIPALGASAFNRAPSGFCAILAKSPAAVVRGLVGGPEMPRELVGCIDDVASPAALASFLDRVLEYWRSHPPHPSGVWRAEEIAALGHALRPCFDRVPPLSLSAARTRQEQLLLTEEQYALLDFLEEADRVICTAGAGCGKTLLAIECLRREHRNNPVLVTGTETLAAHLRATVPDEAGRIFSFSEIQRGAADGRAPYRCLIVDEGQQVTNDSALEFLSTLLLGGFEVGRWRWFSDPNNQVLGNDAFVVGCHDRLARLAVPARLSRNCRNTPQIISAVGVLTAANIGTAKMAGNGPDVTFLDGETSHERAVSAAATIREWLNDPEIQPGEIALLSARPLEHSSVPLIARMAAVPFDRWEPGWDRKATFPRRLAAATIDEFRGLEAPFVVLCDLEAGMPELSKLCYIGLTRANFAVAIGAERECFQILVKCAKAGSGK